MSDSVVEHQREVGAATRVLTSSLTFSVQEPADFVLQIVASLQAGRVERENLEVDGGTSPLVVVEVIGEHGTRLHLFRAEPGAVEIRYRAVIEATPTEASTRGHAIESAYEQEVYLRPSRYCPSDHLEGFAKAEFGGYENPTARVAAIAEWIRRRIVYVPGSSTVHDSAEHTLLTSRGMCRDFAHLGVALCRATGVPARFVSVYAPGLLPMDFHAVFETFESDSWHVHDATGLAPRQALVRIATGRDAADTAFASVNSGVADLESLEVTATVGEELPLDDPSKIVGML